MAKIYLPPLLRTAQKLKNVFSNASTLVVMLLFMAGAGIAQPVNFNSSAYTQDFQTMTASALAVTAISGTTMNQLSDQNGGGTGTTGWYMYFQSGSGTPRWSRDAGSSSTGSFFGMFDAQSTPNRAFGAQGSNTALWYFGVVLKNTSGATINTVTFSYDAMISRNPATTVNPYQLSYIVSSTNVASGSGTGAGTFNDGAGTWIAGTGFSTPSSGTGAPGTQAAISPMFRIGGAAITQTLNNLNWGNNQYLYIRWKETDDAGADAMAGVDNFSLSVPAVPTVNLSVSTNSGSETAQTALTVTATSSSAVTGTQTVSLGVSGTNITAGDYNLSNATITIPNGSTTGSVTFTVADDAVSEGTETAILAISSASPGIALGTTTTQNISITDNDVAGITITQSGGSTNVTEGGATDNYDVALTSQPTSNVTITINADAQVTSSPTTLTFTSLNWNTPQTVTVTAVDDAAVEGTHTGTLSHTASSSDANYNNISISGLTANITDNDVAANPVVNLSVSANSGTEVGTTAITITATTSAAVTGNQTVSLGVSGTGITAGDYNLSNNTITILSGQTTGSVTFTVTDDILLEGTETATLTISNPSAGITLGTNSQNISITDNETDINLCNYVRIGRYDLPEPTRTAAPANSVLAQEASGVAYNWDTQTLFVVGDGGTSVVQVSKTGVLINSMTLAPGSSPQGTDFYDPEGITYVGNGQFVMTEERDRNAVLFTYAAGGTLTRSMAQIVHLGTFVQNIGLEGVSYDPLTGGYIFVKETQPEGIFQTGIDFNAGTATNGSASTVNSVNLFDPALTGLTDFADVFAFSNIPALSAQPNNGNLLILSQESGKIVNIDRSGNISSSLTIVSDPGNPLSVSAQQHEGLTMDRDGVLYVVSENGGGDFDHPQLWVYAPSTTPNQAPTAIALSNKVDSIAENTSTTSRIKVADINVTDDGIICNNNLTLSGADAAFFEITGAELFLKAGTVLDFETKTSYNITINVDDASVGSSPDASLNYTLFVKDLLIETPPGVTLIVSEVAPWSSGSVVGADWFELTNTGTASVNITGWKIDDNSNSFASAVPMSGITTIAPGESVIFLESATPATTIPLFLSTWFGANPPAGLQVGTYTGSGVGLSTGGDAVNIFNANGELQAKVTFGTAPAGPSFATFNNAIGLNNTAISTLSVVGVNDAFVAINDANEIGSPGSIGKLFISEVAPWSSGSSPVAADWFEVTNTKATAVDITGWKMDDNSGSFAAAVALNGITSIAAGESVIFLETGTPASTTTTFLNTWFGANPPSGLQVGSYTGSGVGLGTGGDAVNLYNSTGALQASVLFGTSPTGTFRTFDNAAKLNNATISQLSAVGVNGAFIASNDVNEIGSPGKIANSTCPTITVTATQGAALSCGVTSTTITVSASGGTTPYTGTGTFTVGAGPYNYTVTDANGCSGTTSITVVSNPDAILPTITAPAPVTACTNSGCTATGVNLGTPVTADNCSVASVINNAPASFPLGTTTVTWTVTDASGNTATATQTVTVTDGTAPSIYITQSGLSTGITGPSSSASPYVLPTSNGVKLTSILTTPDVVGGYTMCGVPDGLGAFDNCDGTFTLLMNHELLNTLGAVRAHGSIGSFVSKWIINKNNLSVVSGNDLMQNVNLWNTGTSTYTTYNSANPSVLARFGRFCSADLPAPSAFYNAATGLGTKERIFINGEETNDESRGFAHIVTGPNGGTSWELPAFGKGAWENSVANPATGNKTVVGEMNDGTDGQVYFYIGTKTNTGTEIEKAGLTNGHPFGVKVTGFSVERVNTTTVNNPPAAGTHFDLVDLGDVRNITGAVFNTNSNTAGITKFSRPEDGAWDPSNLSDFYFNTTDQLDQIADGTGTQVGRSRVWKLHFTNINNPELGGTIEAVIDGTEGINMLDNMTIDKFGHLILNEDVGNAAHNGKVWQYTIATDQLVQIAKHDPARFGNIGIAATAPFNQDEETSGVLDVSDILGAGMHLMVDQAHYAIAGQAVEGGQLLAMFVPASIGTVSTAMDTIRTYTNSGCTATGVALGSPATADNCSVASVTNNAPAAFPIGTTNVTWTVTDGSGNTATATQVVIVSDTTRPTITVAPVSTCTNSGCTATGVRLGEVITDNCSVASITNNAPANFPLGTTTVTWTVTDGSGNTATATQTVTVTDGTAPSIYITQSGLVPGVTGPSSSASPYVLPASNGVKLTSILTTPDVVGGYTMCGVPDGLGAFDNCDGTFTLLMNHEILNTLGAVRAHGSIGSFVSKWIINKNNLSVVSGSDLMQNVNLWNTGTSTYTTYNSANPSVLARFGRFCSADLPAPTAFYNAATGMGTKERIFMNGEETNDESRGFAHIVTGLNGGTSWELPAFGKGAWENSVANPATGNKTVVGELNDGTDGQVYFYIGTKTNTGTEIEKAGLTNGHPFGVKVTGFSVERVNTTTINTPPAGGTHFDLVDLGDVKNITGAEFNTNSNTAGITKFSRPEDGAWDPSNPSDFYFNTTDQLDQVADGVGTQVGRSRVWKLHFTDINNPELGGTIEAVIDGTEGINMLDNMTIDKSGHLILNEDVGNAPHNGKVWQYTIATDQLVQIAKHDPARFGNIGVPATAPFNQDEETSGVLDVSDILGAGMHLMVDQAHYAIAGQAVEGGQLLAMFVPASVGTVSTAVDTIRVSIPFGQTTATGVALGTPATADNCSVASVTNNAPASFPIGTTNVTWTVTDGAGNTASAQQVVIVSVNGNIPPTVSISNPVSPATFNAGSTIEVDVTAADSDGSITKVELFSNGVLFAVDSIAPYTFTGMSVEPGIYKVTAKATDNAGAIALTDTTYITVIGCNGGGSISGEGYPNIPGGQVSDLTGNPTYPNSPSVTASLTSFEYKNMGNNYGARVRGYICAPVTGLYTFYIAADDQAGLWLSTDEDPAHKALIAYTERATGLRNWYQYPTQKSIKISLVKGARYYIETLHKQATGGDHLSVAWVIPGGAFEGPIPGSRLSPIGSTSPNFQRGAEAFAQAMLSSDPVSGWQVVVSPNPSTTYFTITSKSNVDKSININLMDASGRIVESKLNMSPNGTLQVGEKLSAGMYFMELTQGTEKKRIKLVRQ